MQNDLPFFESPEDALKAAVAALGGAKKVGRRVFPDKGVDAAGRYLLDCINTERNEKLSMTQMMMLFRLAADDGYHAPFFWLSSELGYDAKPVSKPEEIDRLTTVIEQSTKALAAALSTMQRLQQPARV